MEGLELLDALIQKNEELVEIAEVQMINDGYTKGWARDKAKSEKTLKVLKAIRKGFEKERAKVMDFYKPHRPGFSVPRLCWSNYRVMLFPDNRTGFIEPFFWTPELNIDNSHHALWQYAMSFRDSDGAPIYDSDYRWGGFYTYGLGNGDQKQLTLYGESSDYPHDKWAEKVKECFLTGRQFLPEIIESEIEDELPF